MNKKDFQSLVTPLSEKERYYQDHPELSGSFFKTVCSSPKEASTGTSIGTSKKTSIGTSEGTPILTLDNSILNDLSLSTHGQLFSKQPAYELSKNIVFSKQTRFSVVPLHRHTFIEMNYVYSGSCTACINDMETQLNEGDVCIMDVGVIHTIYPAGENDIILNSLMPHSYFNYHFTDRLSQSGPVSRFLASALNEHTEHDQYLIFHTHHDPLIRELFENVFCEYLDPALCSSDVIDSYMTLIFIQLARCYQDYKEKEYQEHKQNYMTEILRYIENHCTGCTLKSVAERFNFHHKYLSRIIHNATGQTFKELVTQARLKQAVFLLQNTSQQIGDIAAQCGWSNQRQFYKKFAEVYGCTPKAYRESEQK